MTRSNRPKCHTQGVSSERLQQWGRYPSSTNNGTLSSGVDAHVCGVVSLMAHMGVTGPSIVPARQVVKLGGGPGDVETVLWAKATRWLVPAVKARRGPLWRGDVIADLWEGR
jgi:hypothetical protein